MGKIQYPRKKKLIIGLIYKDEGIMARVESLLAGRFGPTDYRVSGLPFSQTEYYKKEMGPGLKRALMSFSRLCEIERSWRVKLITNGIERKFSKEGRRAVNIDPGYVSLSSLALLTTKDYAHRLYMGNGIFSEVTLIFQQGTFRPCEYTYPDYRSDEYVSFFNAVRKIYSSQLK